MSTASILTVNNIEVIYDHVILVLKGVSLQVPEGGVVALLGGKISAAGDVDYSGIQATALADSALEAETLAKLNHPGIVTVHDAGLSALNVGGTSGGAAVQVKAGEAVRM